MFNKVIIVSAVFIGAVLGGCLNLGDTKSCSGVSVNVPLIPGYSSDASTFDATFNSMISSSVIQCSTNVSIVNVQGGRQFMCYQVAASVSVQATQLNTASIVTKIDISCASPPASYTVCKQSCTNVYNSFGAQLASQCANNVVANLNANSTSQCNKQPDTNCVTADAGSIIVNGFGVIIVAIVVLMS